MRDESSRTHDVFLSYSSRDKTWADAACAVLERHRVRCWIAPRDITPGDEWGAAIIKGLNGSRMMVLILSGHANASEQVRREVERAISRGMAVLPVRIEDVRPEGAMEFALGNRHWLDAFTPPMERQLELLARSVKTILGDGVKAGAASAPAEPAAVAPGESPDVAPTRRPPWVWPSVVVAVLVLGFLASWLGGVFTRGLSSSAVGSSARPQVDKPAVSPATSREMPSEAAPKPGTGADSTVPLRLTVNSIGLKLVLIPTGEFLMGSPDSDRDATEDEKPQHRVRITRPFYLGVTEVTQGQYRSVTGKNPSFFKGPDDRPVERVSWYDAIAFCNKLSEREGLKPYYQSGAGVPSGSVGYRLPTEAEWEYACRAGTSTRYSFGDAEANLGEYAWFGRASSVETHPVGQKCPNKFGLYDMHGNVWEWCWDGYDKDYYRQSPVVDATSPLQTSDRVSRGGSWAREPGRARSAARRARAPTLKSNGLGFRLVRGQTGR